MSIMIAVLITAAVLGVSGACWHFWIRREHRGRRARYDPAHSAYLVIDDVANRAQRDEKRHRDFMRTTARDDPAPHAPEPGIGDTGPRLIADKANPALLCGDYGGAEPQPEWPTEAIA
jgi:hypothetical protein